MMFRQAMPVGEPVVRDLSNLHRGADIRRRVILITLGTRGDIEPFAAIARHLTSAGQRVDFLTNENWQVLVEETGARFVSIAPADPPQSGRNDHSFFVENTFPSFRKSFDHIADVVASEGRPALAYRLNMLGAECAAERFGLDGVRIVLQPSAIRSYARPPWPLTGLAQHWWGAVGRSVVVPAIYMFGDILSPYRRWANEFRRSVDVPARKLFGDRHDHSHPWMLLCPDWFALPQNDWPASCIFAGFPERNPGCPDQVTAEFLRRQPEPILFTPGTGVSDVSAFLSAASEACRALGSAAIFVSPFVDPRVEAEDLFIRSFVDLSWLLPYCRAVVHHGGIGTTAEAIRAGIPQLILAGRFDQPDNAVRVAQLGLGGAILSDRPSPTLIEKALGQILGSNHVACQVSTAAQLIRKQNGAEEAASLLLAMSAAPAERFA